jgi:hypothetical protein
MKFKAIHILLLVSFFATAVFSLSVLNDNTIYVQFIHLLQSSPSGGNAAIAAAQSQPSSLPDVFQKVENSVVQITSTKSNPNEVIILNGVPQTGRRNGQIMDLTATLQDRPQTNPTSSSQDQNQSPDLGPIPELPQIPGFPQLPQLPPLLL